MALITISKEYACDTEAFADSLADKLGYPILDKKLVSEATKRLSDDQKAKDGHQESEQAGMLGLVNKYTATIVQQLVDRSYRLLDEKAYHDVTKALILQAAQEKSMIIVGWGGQCILQSHHLGIHLRIVKDYEDRIAWVKARAGLDEKSIVDLIEREEKQSANYIRRYFGHNWDDPHLYHLVINLSKLTTEQAVTIVIEMVKQHKIGTK